MYKSHQLGGKSVIWKPGRSIFGHWMKRGKQKKKKKVWHSGKQRPFSLHLIRLRPHFGDVQGLNQTTRLHQTLRNHLLNRCILPQCGVRGWLLHHCPQRLASLVHVLLQLYGAGILARKERKKLQVPPSICTLPLSFCTTLPAQEKGNSSN